MHPEMERSFNEVLRGIDLARINRPVLSAEGAPEKRPTEARCSVATGSEIADWIERWTNHGINRASAELSAMRYITGTMVPCLLRTALEQSFPNGASETRRGQSLDQKDGQ